MSDVNMQEADDSLLTQQLNGEATKKNGMLSQEREDLVERVAHLEKKVQEQADELVCLKSAMADILRKLHAVEASAAAPQNNILPSRPFRSAQPRRSVGGDRKLPVTPLENANLVPHRSHPPSRTVKSPGPTQLKKWSSLSNSADLSNPHLTPSNRSISHHNLAGRSGSLKGIKEPTWNQEEGYLKIYLKGRAVSMYAPSSVSDFSVSQQAEAPSETLQLEWVYGYRGRDCRSNLYYLPTGEIVYFIAAAVVLHNVEEGMQRHYLGHTDDVKCLAIHPDKVRIATGQVAGHEKNEGKKRRSSHNEAAEVGDTWPHVRIWDSVSLNTLQVLGLGDFDRAVCCVSFSKLDGGNHLVVVDEANEHVISVWDLSREKPKKITETKSSTEPVLAAEFHPSEKHSIVTCGKGQISFWTVEGGTLNKRQGIFDKYDKPKYVLCLAFTDGGEVLSGDSNGSIFVWGKGTNRISQAVVGAHDGGIFSLCSLKDGTIVSGGGKDRKIIQWNSGMKKTGQEIEIEERLGPVRTLSQGKGNLILVGTTRNCILQGSLDLKLTPIVEGHMDELWGLATHPSQHQFLTCGADKHLYLWDSMAHTVIWTKEIAEPAHSCCFYPDGNVAVVGTHNARWMVFDMATHEVVTTHSDGNEQIECLQFSPDGNYLAVGSRDNYIYVYQVSDGGRKYNKIGRCSGHSSFITHLDWDTDSQYLVSNSGDYEILYWSANNCRQMTTPSTLRELRWATNNCTLSFNTAGIWPDGADGTDVNNCARSHKQHLVASADDFGKVKLYKYPCCQPKSAGHSYRGHSSHVTSVDFLFDDSRLISTGGRDMSIMQWEVA